MAALMANQRAAEAMLDEPRRAMRALMAVPARAADGERRVTAAI
jgi:hypothetical protein